MRSSRHQRHHPPRRRKQGFSRPVSGQWYRMLGVPRAHRREFFNMLSKNVVGAFAITAGTVGLVEWGWIGAVVIAVLGTMFGVWFVTQDRMFR
jgi:hypothetical protein